MKTKTAPLVALLCLLAAFTTSAPLGTAFTYQGQLKDAGLPANASYDFQFKLFDAAAAGAQIGSTILKGDVAVSAGQFSVSLDFGATPFAGQSRFLEIGVRPGASTGAYTLLGARQELTPSPNALHSATTSDAEVQRRTVSPACSVGQYVRAIAADGTPTCASDANSGGTVTSVTPGSGLSGGTITGSGTISVAPLGITSSMIANGAISSGKIANGAVGAAQVDSTQVQTRVLASCPPGDYLRGVNADGSVLCGTYFVPPAITTVDDPANLVGNYTSLALGADGFPVIAYHDSTASALKVAKCANPTCTGTTTITTIDDSANTVGLDPSIAIGADGFPVISYADFTAGTLKVAKCVNTACTGASTITVVDDPPVNMVGEFSSIAISVDTFPVMSYWDRSGTLKVAKCVNAACTGASIVTTVDDPVNGVGNTSSLAIGPDGFPVIAYSDTTAFALKFAKCVNAACTGATLIRTLDDSTNLLGVYPSLAIGADGLAVISYKDATLGALKVAKCFNAVCNVVSTLIVDDPVADVGAYNSIAIGADGLPIVSYQDSTAGALKVAKCTDVFCSGPRIITTVDDPANTVGAWTSMAVGNDGLPVISHHDVTAGALKVAKCNKASCAQ